MNRSIRSYFQISNNNTSDQNESHEDITIEDSQSTDSDLEVFEGNFKDKTIKDYEEVLRKNVSLKSVAKIILNGRKGTGSIVWDYFGTLTIRGKSVHDKVRFCKICFEMEVTTLKG